MEIDKHLVQIANLENISIDLEAEDESGKVKYIFCENWDDAKKVLLLMETLIKNPIVRGIINIVIFAGDSIKRKVCEEE